MSIVLIIPLVPRANAAIVGNVCLSPASLGQCPQNPWVYTSATASLLVSVNINGSDSISGFEVYIRSNNTGVLDIPTRTPPAVNFTGSIFPAPSILVECIDNVAIVGTCTAQDISPTGTGIFHLGVGQSGFLSGSPITGRLFTMTYTINSKGGAASLTYQTGCTATSVKGTTDCVSITGTSLNIPETDQPAKFTNIGPGANWKAKPAAGTAPLITTLNATQSFPSPTHTITAYHWNFGDGNSTFSTTLAIITHKYVNPGNYTAALFVVDSLVHTSPVTSGLVIQVRASPTISTLLSGTAVSPGTAVHDSATLSAATATASGTVKYTAWNNGLVAGCSGTVVFTQTVFVSAGVIPNSNSFTFTNAGYYTWRAVYSGDANNNPATSPCEPLTVGQVTSLSTTLNATSIAVGGTVHDNATLTATSTAGGTVDYYLFNNGACTGSINSATLISTVLVTNAAVPGSASQTFTTSGFFSWKAVYDNVTIQTSDPNNTPAASSCEPLNVGVTTPTLVSVVVGTDGNLYWSPFTGTFGAWQTLNGQSPSPPSLCPSATCV